MYSIFWKSLFSSLMIIFLFANICFACDIVMIVNPTAISPQDYSTFPPTNISFTEYYVGVSSFIDAFKVYFGENSALTGFTNFMSGMGKFMSNTINIYLRALDIAPIRTTGDVFKYVVAIFMWVNSLFPLFCGVGYLVVLIIYIIFMVFSLAAFVVYYMGGGFAIKMPSIDWYDSYQQYGYDWSQITNTIRAMMV